MYASSPCRQHMSLRHSSALDPPWSSGMDGRPMSSRLGPHHLPPPPLVPIQPQRDYGYQAEPVDRANQVECKDRLDLANF